MKRGICIALLALILLGSGIGAVIATRASSPPVGTYNPFPAPWCTWGADAEFYTLHRYYPPWHINSTAYQWPDRAREFGWQVHIRAAYGDIVAMQPWVQGAYGSGHVAVVIKVYGDGSVLASTTSWGANPWIRQNIHVYQAHGVLFIHI